MVCFWNAYSVLALRERRSNVACSGFHSFKDQWANVLAFGGFSGKQSPVGRCTGPRSWSYYFSWCAALTFSARSTMDRKRDDWHRTRRERNATEWRRTRALCWTSSRSLTCEGKGRGFELFTTGQQMHLSQLGTWPRQDSSLWGPGIKSNASAVEGF